MGLFAVGPFGAVRDTFPKGDKGWQPWSIIGNGTIQEPIVGDLVLPAGAAIAVLDRQPHGEHRVDLFIVARDGRVQTTFSEAKK